jgi:hypothetical protein
LKKVTKKLFYNFIPTGLEDDLIFKAGWYRAWGWWGGHAPKSLSAWGWWGGRAPK